MFLPIMSAYKREFDKTKYMSFLIKDNELLEKYYKIQQLKTVSKKNLTVNLSTMKNI